jgi:serine/threonine protein kinase
MSIPSGDPLALKLARDLAGGVRRGAKPANLLLDEGLRLKIGGFGSPRTPPASSR